MKNSFPIDLAKTPCVFDNLLEPVMDFVEEQHKQVPQHYNQKLDYTTFFRLLMCFFLTHPESLKLFITTKLNNGLLPKVFGFNPVPYSTFRKAFRAFPLTCFEISFSTH